VLLYKDIVFGGSTKSAETIKKKIKYTLKLKFLPPGRNCCQSKGVPGVDFSFGSDATLWKVTTPSAKTPNAIKESTFMLRMISDFLWNIFVSFCFICGEKAMVILLLSRGVADRGPSRVERAVRRRPHV